MTFVRVGARSDRGRRRAQNEDAYLCDPPLFAVADGMGGHHAGEIASRLATAALEEHVQGVRGEAAVTQLIELANERIYRAALEDPSAAGMGTTVTVALLDDDCGALAIGHVGDSRAYRLRDGELEQLTADHSLVAELVRGGRLTEEEARDHPQRSVITRAAGTEPHVQIDTLTVETLPGDTYLLCSDGLSSMVTDASILAILERERADPGRAATALVEAANRAGGEDNITVVLFSIADEAEAPDTADPDEPTAESVLVSAEPPIAPVPDAQPVQRHGAGKGGRLLAILAVLAVVAAAAFVVWWGLR